MASSPAPSPFFARQHVAPAAVSTQDHKRYVKEPGACRPLEGIQIVVGTFQDPPKRTVEKLLSAAGAVCCREKKGEGAGEDATIYLVQDCDTFYASSGSDKKVGSRYTDVRTAAWLFDCIESGKHLSATLQPHYSIAVESSSAPVAEVELSQGS